MGEMCRTKFDSHFWAGGSRMVWDSNPTPQNDMQFKTYELCISGVFHLIFSVNNWGLTETTESDTWDQRGWPCSVVAFRWKKHWKGPLEAKSDCKMAHLFLCEEAQAWPQPETKTAGSKPRDEDNDDAEVIFVGVQHVNEDAETLFVRVISSSKPVISNIWTEWPDSEMESQGDLNSPWPLQESILQIIWLWPWKVSWPHQAMFMVRHHFHRFT